MDLDFTEEQHVLREMVRGVCAEYAPLEVVRALENDARGVPEGLWKQLVVTPGSERELGFPLMPSSS